MIYLLIYFLFFIYEEVLYKLFTHTPFGIGFVSLIFYSLFLAGIFSLIESLLPNKISKIFHTLISVILCVFYSASIIVYNTFSVNISLNYLSLASNFTGAFASETSKTILRNIPVILLVFIPLVLYLIFMRKIKYKYKFKKVLIIFALTCISFYGFLLSFTIPSNSLSSSLYFKKNDLNSSSKTFGVLPSTLIDTRKTLTGFTSSIIIDEVIEDEPKIEEIVYDPQILDINFNLEEENKNYKLMNEYFSKESYTYKNEYTGLFKGKNLIYVMAESFDGYFVNEKLTPTLYKMIHSGLEFTNYYSPTNLSTIGGEFTLLNGLLPNLYNLNHIWNQSNTNYYPYGLGNIFKDLNYTTYAYHDHTYNFQNRDAYLGNIGLDNYKGCWSGLEKKMACTIFPESDKEMIDTTYEDFINDENFMVYYVSVSGHGNWLFGDNDMADKNRSEVEDLNYSDIIKGYIAGNLELEKAMTRLLEVLEENNRLEDTVIVLAADHHPYFLSNDEMSELAGYPLDQFDLYRNNLIIYNSEMENIKIDKPCATVDVLPTTLNLFGIDYDSRLIIGKDILSNSEGLVIYADGSWLNETGRFNINTNEFTPLKDMDNIDSYVERMNNIVYNKNLMSEYILKYDYHKYLSQK